LPTGGHPEKWPRREIVDGIRYLMDNGIKWRSMPSDYPPWRTIYGFARRWAAAGVLGVFRDHLRRRIRLAAGKTPQTASVIVDSQSVKVSETVSKATREWDGGKQIDGRKRHMICDHRSLVLLIMVTPADAQDSLVARELLFRLALLHPEIAIVWADSAMPRTIWCPGRRSTSTSPSRRCDAHQMPRALSCSRAGGQWNGAGHGS
jgi:transposase